MESHTALTAIGVLVAVIGVVVAVLAWRHPVLPGSDAPGEDSDTAEAGPTQTETGNGQLDGAADTQVRHLTEMAPIEGGALVSRVGEHDLDMPCGTNQSDDRSREVVYALPTEYQQFAVDATANGTADQRAQVELSIFVHDRYDRSDRERQVATSIAALGVTESLDADITNARTVTLRLRCESSQMVVRLSAPHVSR